MDNTYNNRKVSKVATMEQHPRFVRRARVNLKKLINRLTEREMFREMREV